MPQMALTDCGVRGVGVVSLEDIEVGDFVGEYVGEVMSQELYNRRRMVSELPNAMHSD